MKKIQHIHLASFPLVSLLLLSCESEKSASSTPKKSQQYKVVESPNEPKVEEQEIFDMTNPAFMMGTNIGSLFKTYYKVGDFERMITYTSSATIKKFGRAQLLTLYRDLNLGFDMVFKKMTSEGDEKVLHYETIINATKQVKRLHVVIENDTARVVPQHLEEGEIFE